MRQVGVPPIKVPSPRGRQQDSDSGARTARPATELSPRLPEIGAATARRGKSSPPKAYLTAPTNLLQGKRRRVVDGEGALDLARAMAAQQARQMRPDTLQMLSELDAARSSPSISPKRNRLIDRVAAAATFYGVA